MSLPDVTARFNRPIQRSPDVMSEIIYPSIDLFVYQLGFGLGANEDKTKTDAADFLANFPLEYREKAAEKMKSLEKPQSDVTFFCDSPKQEYPLPNSETLQFQPYPLDGHYDPARLGDSYGFLLDASIEEEDKQKTLKPQPISSFAKALEPLVASKNGNLGKTCILYGYLPPSADAEVLAKSIYREFARSQLSRQQLSPEEIGDRLYEELHQWQQGKFLGADLFVAWQPPQIWQDLPQYQGIYIILYPDPEPELKILQQAARFHENWLRLFWFQNKILWARDQGRQLKQKLEANFGEMRETFLEIEETKLDGGDLDLQHLQSVLKNKSKTIASYAVHLSLLEIQQSTLETNLYNYRLCLSDLEAKAKKIAPTDLGVLREFADIAEQRYQKQLQKDYASLKPGLDALENTINPLNSIVELEQAQRDRDFQETVETWGFGLASAAVAAATLSPFVPAILKQDSREGSPQYFGIEGSPQYFGIESFVVATSLSILAGIVAKKIAPFLLRSGKRGRV